jgi:hypothetical protein
MLLSLRIFFRMKNSYSISKLPENVIAYTSPDTSKNLMHAEHTL